MKERRKDRKNGRERGYVLSKESWKYTMRSSPKRKRSTYRGRKDGEGRKKKRHAGGRKWKRKRCNTFSVTQSDEKVCAGFTLSMGLVQPDGSENGEGARDGGRMRWGGGLTAARVLIKSGDQPWATSGL